MPIAGGCEQHNIGAQGRSVQDKLVPIDCESSCESHTRPWRGEYDGPVASRVDPGVEYRIEQARGAPNGVGRGIGSRARDAIAHLLDMENYPIDMENGPLGWFTNKDFFGEQNRL